MFFLFLAASLQLKFESCQQGADFDSRVVLVDAQLQLGNIRIECGLQLASGKGRHYREWDYFNRFGSRQP